jgi:predicted SAM-dependent methyltransferase
MNMIQRIERLEQRVPSSVRSAVWGGLRIPHQVVRHKVVSDYLASHAVRKLQVGCGGNILSGWLNSDLNPVRSMGVYLANRRMSDTNRGAAPRPLRDVIFVDATKPLPFRDRVFDYVFSEHMIEHIPFRDAMGLLKDVFRVLKPGGKLRLSTPDLAFLIALSDSQKTDVQRRYIAWATATFQPGLQGLADAADADTFIINNFVRNWGHQFIYDQKTLWSALASCGFCQMKRCDPGESCDVNLCGIESHGRRIGDEFNRLESIVVEATKDV